MCLSKVLDYKLPEQFQCFVAQTLKKLCGVQHHPSEIFPHSVFLNDVRKHSLPLCVVTVRLRAGDFGPLLSLLAAYLSTHLFCFSLRPTFVTYLCHLPVHQVLQLV